MRMMPSASRRGATALFQSLYLGLVFAASSSTAWAYRGVWCTRMLHTGRTAVPSSLAPRLWAAPNGLDTARPAVQGLWGIGGASRVLTTGGRHATATTDTAVTGTAGPAASDKAWKINLLYDSDCPLCMKEVEFLRKRDIMGDIRFTDLNDLNYRPEDNGGVSFENGMKVIHAILPDGTAVKGVEVFRQVYDILGLGWVYAATRWPLVGPAVDKLYDVWAVNRLRITGRPDLEAILKERAEKLQAMTFEDCSDKCELPDDF